jgi:hypothetical protein
MNLHANQGTGSAYTALNSVFGDNAPTESAFSQMRNSVSWRCFENFFNQTASAFCEKLRPDFKGYFLTAIDGDQYLLERTKDSINNGFKGQKCGEGLETQGLKMYLTIATCMITGAPLAINTSPSPNELESGIETTKKTMLLQTSELSCVTRAKQNIFCYDRLYFGKRIIDLHKDLNTYFVARCKIGGTFSQVKDFIESNQDSAIVEIFGMKIRLIKATHKDSDYFYATNNFDKNIDDENISWIYLRRWESETLNCHGTKILGIEKFHSTKINGILQEIYSSFFALLISKSNRFHVKQTKEDFDKKSYRRQNTKKVFTTLTNNVLLLLDGKVNDLLNKLEAISEKYTRLIARLSRNFPRKRKYRRQKDYPQQKPLENPPP